ncbi:MAG: hypothetical protein PHP59_09975 [Methanofollis sp.]|uniref:hypothetical protein n=1 Tax=Methanofollis sp. TaxID=2052835 RepID=UPI0026271DEF|nr:hypothetical protein [Methanofollis sp.]MDD4255686.1 hypothetical protein [Methanofollis sp.]
MRTERNGRLALHDRLFCLPVPEQKTIRIERRMKDTSPAMSEEDLDLKRAET